MYPLTPADLPPDLQRRVRRHALSPGQILVQQGEKANSLFWVASGQVRLASFLKHQMITYYFVKPGDLFGESTLHFDTYGCTAIAEVPSEVIAIPKLPFTLALQQSPELSQRYLDNLSYRFHTLKSLLELRSINSGRDRILHYLMQRLPAGQTTLALDKPLKEVASELALTPEAFSRLLTRLQNEGIISRKKRSITVSRSWLDGIAN
ncbi:Crp/Fnr family transcriptional regulator [Leptolyngbya sp. PCC 6406]|uniref:Crp/Fnr family transcriptional regulator n=1 Tax=Leptolyngbya sp. PCC 6406 TaxID=1173264 RepID=UPI0002AD152D|nr:Crp/Fnr family transcriptional regulator [Leptolyngbya sp. PCC 6406]